MKTFTFEVNGYCFYFECETWEQFGQALKATKIYPDPGSMGEMVFKGDTNDKHEEDSMVQ